MEMFCGRPMVQIFHVSPNQLHQHYGDCSQNKLYLNHRLTLPKPPPRYPSEGSDVSPCTSLTTMTSTCPFTLCSFPYINTNTEFGSYTSKMSDTKITPESSSSMNTLRIFPSHPTVQFPNSNTKANSTLSVLTPTPSTIVSSIRSGRPFTAYPFPCPSVALISKNYSSIQAYKEFRRKVFSQFSTPSVRRRAREGETKDLQRRKNNEASKRSREARKDLEDEIAIRCAFLEQENAQIRARLVGLEMEVKLLEQELFRI